MLTVTKIFTFDACHSLPDYVGPCARLHGHTYKLEVTVCGELTKKGPKRGMIIDFSVLKKIVEKEVISKYDHDFLNNFFENPTAENMVVRIGDDIDKALPKGVKLYSVKLWEKIDSSCVEYNKFLDSMMESLAFDGVCIRSDFFGED